MELEKRSEAGCPVTSYGYEVEWTSPNLRQGPGALAFLDIQLAGSTVTNVLQLWDNDGTLGMILYQPADTGGYEEIWSSSNMGQGSGAIAFLTGDVNGDGATEVIQLWDNDGTLGMVVYTPTTGGDFAVSWQNPNMKQGSGAVKFIAADVNGDGKTEIVQLWDNNGRLGLILYVSNKFGGYDVGFSDGDIGAGSGAITFLTADMNGDGHEEVVQLWDNNGRLGMIVYAISNKSCTIQWSEGELGAGSGAIAFLTGDFDGSGKTSIAQLWANGSQLGIALFTPTAAEGGYRLVWNNSDMGQGTGAVAFLTGDVNGDGLTDIIQLWDNHGVLGIVVYSPTTNGGFGASWMDGNMDQGSGAVAFLTTSISGTFQTGILQLWNNTQLAAVLYTPVEV